MTWCISPTLRWRHNDHAGVSNHQPHGCLLNLLFRRNSKKTSKLRVTGLCAENSPGTGEFPAQMASYAENVSIWWRHHACVIPGAKWSMICWGKMVLLWGKMEQRYGAKWHTLTNACVSIYWECFDEFTSARSVPRELRMRLSSKFNVSMVVRMNESQIVQSY